LGGLHPTRTNAATEARCAARLRPGLRNHLPCRAPESEACVATALAFPQRSRKGARNGRHHGGQTVEERKGCTLGCTRTHVCVCELVLVPAHTACLQRRARATRRPARRWYRWAALGGGRWLGLDHLLVKCALAHLAAKSNIYRPKRNLAPTNRLAHGVVI
jgi:hypothetical protein